MITLASFIRRSYRRRRKGTNNKTWRVRAAHSIARSIQSSFGGFSYRVLCDAPGNWFERHHSHSIRKDRGYLCNLEIKSSESTTKILTKRNLCESMNLFIQ